MFNLCIIATVNFLVGLYLKYKPDKSMGKNKKKCPWFGKKSPQITIYQ